MMGRRFLGLPGGPNPGDTITRGHKGRWRCGPSSCPSPSPPVGRKGQAPHGSPPMQTATLHRDQMEGVRGSRLIADLRPKGQGLCLGVRSTWDAAPSRATRHLTAPRSCRSEPPSSEQTQAGLLLNDAPLGAKGTVLPPPARAPASQVFWKGHCGSEFLSGGGRWREPSEP